MMIKESNIFSSLQSCAVCARYGLYSIMHSQISNIHTLSSFIHAYLPDIRNNYLDPGNMPIALRQTCQNSDAVFKDSAKPNGLTSALFIYFLIHVLFIFIYTISMHG